MKIRRASIADFKPLLDLLTESEKSEARFDLTIRPSEASKKSLKQALEVDLRGKSEKVYFVVEGKGELLGFACVNKSKSTPEIGWIGEIFVKEKFRRRGVATKLIKKATIYLRGLRKKFARLAVHRLNKRAQRLYKKVDFYKRPAEYFVLEKGC